VLSNKSVFSRSKNMVKKVKAATGKFEKQAEKQADNNMLASAIKESAQQIWLAGLGAFAKAQAEGGKVFETLVTEGMSIQRKTRSLAEEKLGEVTGKASKMAGEFTKQANDSWDKLENVFEGRVERALSRLGVPTNKDIQALIARVDALNGSVKALGAKPSARAKAAPAQAATVAKAAKKTTTPAARKARKATSK
jgi:poly(hydroxyalkanoate) granule-associated protein